ncbi:MAG: symmetrical bis(5'-nucleosyl)-tetraphosphatase, partial [Mariprofundaceae bacterium]|nr:symmetrical bis(5'-nucleosyl)-tetraphosphatase [Mariprofundaceae bacterium]
IQGCYNALRRLLDKVAFDPQKDVLWCAGDLVNRGPDSLQTLRFLKAFGDSCVCVLGNHDLHLLEQSCGGRQYKSDTFETLLAAKDADILIEWLRYQPLIHTDKKLGWCMVHAGLHPQWTLKQTKKRAKAVHAVLRSGDWQTFCMHLHHAEFPKCEPKGSALHALIFTTAVLTRARYCTAKGSFNWHVRAGEAKRVCEKPWFAHDDLAWRKKHRIVYGHWAAKGLMLDQAHVLGLDSGCVWGGGLSLARLDKKKTIVTTVPSDTAY